MVLESLKTIYKMLSVPVSFHWVLKVRSVSVEFCQVPQGSRRFHKVPPGPKRLKTVEQGSTRIDGVP